MAKSTKRNQGWRFAAGVLTLLVSTISVRADDAASLLDAPNLPPYEWFASTDPQNRNADYIPLKPGETRRVPLAAGNLERLWSTAFEPDKITLVLQNGNQRVELLRNNKARFGELYKKAFTFYPTRSTPAAARELQKGATLIATNHSKTDNKWFYQATVRPNREYVSSVSVVGAPKVTEPGTPLPLGGFSMVGISGTTLGSGEVLNLLDGLKENGLLTGIEIVPENPKLEALADLWLQAKWQKDGPTFEMPLVAFLGNFPTGQSKDNKNAMWNNGSFALSWEMPFAVGAALSVKNMGDQPLRIKRAGLSLTNLTTPYRLCFASGSTRSQKGKPIPILKVQGAGAFVGLVLDIRPAPDTTRRTFAFLEGNETLIADGKTYEGTGTEDYFNSAWYYPGDPFTRPYHGMTFKGLEPPRVTTYRWMIPDAVPFKNSFEFQLEHGNGNNSNDLEYRWVAFWYQKAPFDFEIADALKNGSGEQGSTPGAQAAGQSSGASVILILATLGALAALGLLLFAWRSRGRSG